MIRIELDLTYQKQKAPSTEGASFLSWLCLVRFGISKMHYYSSKKKD
jgi:hypothetical protein